MWSALLAFLRGLWASWSGGRAGKPLSPCEGPPGDQTTPNPPVPVPNSALEVSLTCYWLVLLDDPTTYRKYLKAHPGEMEIALPEGKKVRLPTAFLAAVEVEGGGVVGDNLFSFDGKEWKWIPRRLCPWGIGAYNNPLKPFYSIAVDQHWKPAGAALAPFQFRTKWRIRELVGSKLPTGEPWDGIVEASDTGDTIDLAHIDLFCGLEAYDVTASRKTPFMVHLEPVA